MKTKANEEQQPEARDHLERLRDFLDLPFSTLNDGELAFLLADECHVVASYTQTGHISLICDIARLDALSVEDWRWLVTALSRGHAHAFPTSLVTVDGMLALMWGCDANMATESWIRRVEDALTHASVIHGKLNAGKGSARR